MGRQKLVLSSKIGTLLHCLLFNLAILGIGLSTIPSITFLKVQSTFIKEFLFKNQEYTFLLKTHFKMKISKIYKVKFIYSDPAKRQFLQFYSQQSWAFFCLPAEKK